MTSIESAPVRRNLWPLAAVFLAGVLFAGWIQPAARPTPSPWMPPVPGVPDPHASRPILAGIVRIAKQALWLMAFAEPSPVPAEEQRAIKAGEDQQRQCDADGDPLCRNGHGW